MKGLRLIRKQRNLNQQKVAMDLNISREALSYYENGKREWVGHRMKMEKDILSEKDPFSWSESEMVILLNRPPCYNHFGWSRVNKDDADSTRQEGGHIVIGPDLVSEWRAKNKKK